MENTFIKGEKLVLLYGYVLVKNIKKTNKQTKTHGVRKSDYSVSDYLGALVDDFIRGKKLQEEEREQRGKNESEEIWLPQSPSGQTLFFQSTIIKQRLVPEKKTPEGRKGNQNNMKPVCKVRICKTRLTLGW